MNAWGPSTFGDPCRLCGFDWSVSQEDADALLAATAERYTTLLTSADGRERHPELDWTAGGYVCHTADSLRVWAERIANVALGDSGPVAPYDQDRLAEARSYGEVGIRGALWSLGRAVGDWRAAVELAEPSDFVMSHDELGEMTLLDVIRIRAHDMTHHAHDIERSIAVAPGR